jgi:hypothetical protein
VSRRGALRVADQQPAAWWRQTSRVSIRSWVYIRNISCTLEEASTLEFLGERRTYRPVLGVQPFGQGPGVIAAFATIYHTAYGPRGRRVS